MKKKLIVLAICLLAFFNTGFAALVDTVSVHSASMNKEVKAVVIVPEQYGDKSKHFPVIYLLHGLSDNQSTWITKVPGLKNLSDEFKVIIVCPDGDYGSWYLDSPVLPKSRYETFISKELVSFMDSHYRSFAQREGRAITGLSMGGHGALYNASRNPGVFVAAGSMSGALDLTHAANGGASLDWVRVELEKRLGPYSTNKESWEKNSVINMVEVLKNAQVQYQIDCGIDDFLIEDNRKLHQKLIAAKVPHRYVENPGAHTWEYWSEQVRAQFEFLVKYLRR